MYFKLHNFWLALIVT